MGVPEIVLVHGVATTGTVWDRVLPLLDGLSTTVVERPASGVLAEELDWLAARVSGRVVVGVSGGATLAIGLAASGVPLAGALAHEPAVGSLVPGLLAPVAAAYERDGPAGFGTALYGPSWTPAMAGERLETVGRELAMFRAFEPAAAAAGQGPVLVTVGGDSPESRQQAAAALHDRLGYRVESIPGARHFVAWDAPEAFAAVIRAFVAGL